MASVRRRLQIGLGAVRELGAWTSQRLTGEDPYLVGRAANRYTAGRSSAWGLALARRIDHQSHPIRPEGLALECRESLTVLRDEGIAAIPTLLDVTAIERIREFSRTAPAVLRNVDGQT